MILKVPLKRLWRGEEIEEGKWKAEAEDAAKRCHVPTPTIRLCDRTMGFEHTPTKKKCGLRSAPGS